MRMRWLLLFSLFLASCESGTAVKSERSESRLEKFIVSFAKAHPERTQNSILKERAGQQLQKEFYDSIATGILKDHPMKLFNIEQGPGGYYYAHFQPDYKTENHVTFDFDIAAKITDEQVQTLKEGNLYFIDGANPEDISYKFKDYMILARTPLFSVKGDSPEYLNAELGITLIDLKSFNKATQ